MFKKDLIRTGLFSSTETTDSVFYVSCKTSTNSFSSSEESNISGYTKILLWEDVHDIPIAQQKKKKCVCVGGGGVGDIEISLQRYLLISTHAGLVHLCYSRLFCATYFGNLNFSKEKQSSCFMLAATSNSKRTKKISHRLWVSCYICKDIHDHRVLI